MRVGCVLLPPGVADKLILLAAADKSSRSRKLKHDVIEAVNELIQDIATCHEQIAEQAVEHIHQKYAICTPSILIMEYDKVNFLKTK